LIESYRFGSIEIDGKIYKNDVKLIGNRVESDWWRSQGHLVQMADVQDLLKANAEFYVFGTGAYGAMKVSDAVKSELESRGSKVVIEPTEPACDTYNKLLKEGKSVVAGFHLSC
jgi:hypothetical protein